MKPFRTVSLSALAWATCMVVSAPTLAHAQDKPGATDGAGASGVQPTPAANALAADRQTASYQGTTVSEIVVTAQKREENIQNVGMSIQAATGDSLIKQGITDTSQLVKIVPGFTFNYGFDGAPIYSLRGVGFQDTSLGAGPAVSVYNDEVPLPYSATTLGSTLDLQRVEVLKGPQGTLFGENSTGGAINYIAGKPTDHLEAGADLSYGRFNTIDAQGFVSGPLTDTLDFRLALRTVQADGWQKSTTRDDTLGGQNLTSGRVSLLWKPTERLRILATASGFYDHGESQAAQYLAALPFSSTPLPASLTNLPAAPKNDRAADWDACFRPLPGQSQCSGFKKRDGFYLGSLRIDYDLGDDLTLTSLSSYQKFQQYYPFDGDGVSIADYESLSSGHLSSVFQEFRLAGKFAGKGSWIGGLNYENSDSFQNIISAFPGSSVAVQFGRYPVQGGRDAGEQHNYSYSAFGHAEYPILENVTVNAGLRYTQTNESFAGSTYDEGLGQTVITTYILQTFLQTLNRTPLGAVFIAPGGASSLGPAPSFTPGVFRSNLNENNVSWRVGLDWKIRPDTLLYANISQGYKSGSFPVIAATLQSQFQPVKQEGLLAYETGFKTQLLDRTLQLNGAFFYYDYADKQVQGDVPDPILGALPKLLNIPDSHVVGFELSGVWRPFKGVTITPAVSYAKSRIDNNFSTYNFLSQLQNVSGEQFPGVPEWQADLDAEYQFGLPHGLSGFVGTNVNYQGRYFTQLGEQPITKVADYALVDLRAGVDRGPWRVQVYGRNVLDHYVVNASLRVVDTYVRYTGLPATYGVQLSYRFK